MGPVAGGRGSRGAPCNGLQLARPAAGGVIVARVAMAPGRLAWQGAAGWHGRRGCNCNRGGDCSMWNICEAAGRGPQHDDMNCAVRGGREGEAGGSCLL